MAALTEPWSKRHKAVTRNDREGLQYNLSNSFAQPTSQAELERLATERGDDELIAAYRDHPLGYTPNGGSVDCRAAVTRPYVKRGGSTCGDAHERWFRGRQVDRGKERGGGGRTNTFLARQIPTHLPICSRSKCRNLQFEFGIEFRSKVGSNLCNIRSQFDQNLIENSPELTEIRLNWDSPNLLEF